MRFGVFFLILFWLSALESFGQKKYVCISVDDLPVVDYGEYDTVVQERILNHLIVSFEKNRIPAIGFVNEEKLYGYDGKPLPFQIHLLEKWLNAGLQLGNHTYSHPDYNIVSFKTYASDILKGELITKQLLRKRGQKLLYFRHPYLHLGPTRTKADSLQNFLNQHRYITAPITIDGEDYAFAYAYYKAKSRRDVMLEKQVVADYLSYIDQNIKHFDKESMGIVGRYVDQIILFHASMLNADCMDDIITIFRKNGYGFLPIDKVLRDPVYKTPITVYGEWGCSWLDRWALTLNKKGDFLMGAPEVPEYIRKLLNE